MIADSYLRTGILSSAIVLLWVILAAISATVLYIWSLITQSVLPMYYLSLFSLPVSILLLVVLQEW